MKNIQSCTLIATLSQILKHYPVFKNVSVAIYTVCHKHGWFDNNNLIQSHVAHKCYKLQIKGFIFNNKLSKRDQLYCFLQQNMKNMSVLILSFLKMKAFSFFIKYIFARKWIYSWVLQTHVWVIPCQISITQKKTIPNPTLSEFNVIWHTSCLFQPPNLKSKIFRWSDDWFLRYRGLIFWKF